MPWLGKIVPLQNRPAPAKNYLIFMVPKAEHKRLFINMTHWQPGPQPDPMAACRVGHQECKLKLSLETRNSGDVMIVHCQGRIVYRNEARALSHLVGELLQCGSKVVLDLSGVSSIDSAGIGELVLLHTRAQSQKAEMKYASPSPLVRKLLGLTHLDSVFEMHSSVYHALAAFQSAEACAHC